MQSSPIILFNRTFLSHQIRRIVIGTVVIGVATSVIALNKPIEQNTYRNFIVKWFGRRTMTQYMANYLAKDDYYLKFIPLKLRTVDIWKQLYKKYNLVGLHNLTTNGKTFNDIVGYDRVFVVPASCRMNCLAENKTCENQGTALSVYNCRECPVANCLWGIRFVDVEHLNHHNNLVGGNVTDYYFNDYKFMWKIKIPNDARVFVGCNQGPDHKHYQCDSDHEVRVDKVVFVEKCINKEYMVMNVEEPYLESELGNDDVNTGG
jgi:hypothetical protein